MRRIILVSLITSLSMPALAQVNDLPAPDASVYTALHPGHAVPYETGKTALQIEAERVEAYRRARALQNPAPMPANPAPAPTYTAPPAYRNASPGGQRAPSVREPVAPKGIENISLYRTPANVGTHSVKKGDTLYNISKRYGVTVQDLQRTNQLRGTNIAIGQTLIVPTQKQASNSAPKVTVQRNKVREIQGSKMNRETSAAPLEADTKSGRTMRYAVVPGDTLDAIARRTCVERNILINENELSNPDVLPAGLMLTLPDDHCLAR